MKRKHLSPVNSPHEGQWRGSLLSLMCVWIYDWISNVEAGDLRRYRAHYDVIVMTATAVDINTIWWLMAKKCHFFGRPWGQHIWCLFWGRTNYGLCFIVNNHVCGIALCYIGSRYNEIRLHIDFMCISIFIVLHKSCSQWLHISTALLNLLWLENQMEIFFVPCVLDQRLYALFTCMRIGWHARIHDILGKQY